MATQTPSMHMPALRILCVLSVLLVSASAFSRSDARTNAKDCDEVINRLIDLEKKAPTRDTVCGSVAQKSLAAMLGGDNYMTFNPVASDKFVASAIDDNFKPTETCEAGSGVSNQCSCAASRDKDCSAVFKDGLAADRIYHVIVEFDWKGQRSTLVQGFLPAAQADEKRGLGTFLKKTFKNKEYNQGLEQKAWRKANKAFGGSGSHVVVIVINSAGDTASVYQADAFSRSPSQIQKNDQSDPEGQPLEVVHVDKKKLTDAFTALVTKPKTLTDEVKQTLTSLRLNVSKNPLLPLAVGSVRVTGAWDAAKCKQVDLTDTKTSERFCKILRVKNSPDYDDKADKCYKKV